ncbi:MAG: hypothetical protein FWE31_00940 [Firmicutes bacterium]|nr:hypothetical protein [Bacillota bacterium]
MKHLELFNADLTEEQEVALFAEQNYTLPQSSITGEEKGGNNFKKKTLMMHGYGELEIGGR